MHPATRRNTIRGQALPVPGHLAIGGRVSGAVERRQPDRVPIRTLRLVDALVKNSLPQTGVCQGRMRAPGGRFGFHGSMQVLSCLIRLAFPHESDSSRKDMAHTPNSLHRNRTDARWGRSLTKARLFSIGDGCDVVPGFANPSHDNQISGTGELERYGIAWVWRN